MPKYVFANGHIRVENGVYSPIKEKETDQDTSVVLIRTHSSIYVKEQEHTKRRNEDVEQYTY
jgi:hypothetical protein